MNQTAPAETPVVCQVTGCEIRIKPGALTCLGHWRMLTPQLQRRFVAAQNKRASKRYLAEALAYLDEHAA